VALVVLEHVVPLHLQGAVGKAAQHLQLLSMVSTRRVWTT
jgi:hypothetical protein